MNTILMKNADDDSMWSSDEEWNEDGHDCQPDDFPQNPKTSKSSMIINMLVKQENHFHELLDSQRKTNTIQEKQENHFHQLMESQRKTNAILEELVKSLNNLSEGQEKRIKLLEEGQDRRIETIEKNQEKRIRLFEEAQERRIRIIEESQLQILTKLLVNKNA